MVAFVGVPHVSVREYLRCWQGVWQLVRAHTRRWPRRKTGLISY
jgi:hypothetical protein